MAVDIGAEAIGRPTTASGQVTRINKTGQATIAGTVTSVDIWAESDLTDLRVGTFYVTNGNTLKCRDSEIIEGTITAGEKVVKVVSLTVEVGDYIGWYLPGAGALEAELSGYAGLWWKSGEYIDPDDEATYALSDGDVASIGGYIEEPSAPAAGGGPASLIEAGII